MRSIITLLFVAMVNVAAHAQKWTIEYNSGEGASHIFISGDNSENYDYFVGFYDEDMSGLDIASAICVDENGNYKDRVFWRDYAKSKFTDALSMGNGNVFVSGYYSDDVSSELYEKLWVAILNPDLEIISERYVDLEEPYITYCGYTYTLRNDDDEIVLLTRVSDYESYEDGYFDYVFYTFDDSCNMTEFSYLENETHRSDITDFTLVPDIRQYAIFGNGMDASGMSNVIYVDEDFNYLSLEFFDDMDDYPDLMLPIWMRAGYWYDESHFLMSAQTTMTTGINDWCPFVVKMDTDMNVLKTLDLERVDTIDYVFQFNSMSYVNPEMIYVATFRERRKLPNELNVYLINDELELLGRKHIVTEDCFFGLHIHSTKDNGCIIVGKETIPDSEPTILYKLGADEFGIDIDVIETECDFEMSCYPNPVSSVMNVNVGNYMYEKVRITIKDVSGRRYVDREILLDGNVLRLDVSPLEVGTYFYEITKNKECIIRSKFIKL